MLVRVASPLPTSSSAWLLPAVALPSSLLACGSLLLVTRLVLLVGYFSTSAQLSLNAHVISKKTAFTSYGAFWISFAALLIPGSGIGAAYAASPDPAKEVDAIAIYLTTWGVVTFLFLYVLVYKIAPSAHSFSFSFPALPLSASRLR